MHSCLLNLIHGFDSESILLKVAGSLLMILLLNLHCSLQMLHQTLDQDLWKGLFHFFEAIAKYYFQWSELLV